MTLTRILRRIRLTSRTTLGLALVALSIGGVMTVVAVSGSGATIVMAREPIVAGSRIEAEQLVEVPIDSAAPGVRFTLADAVGRVAGLDIGTGDVISTRVLEPRESSRVTVSIPLGVAPAQGIVAGSTVTVWSIDDEGVLPPMGIARVATVVGIVESGFGADTVATVAVESIEVDRVLAALGSNRIIVLTAGGES